MEKIGKFLASLLFFGSLSAFGAEAEFTATLDKNLVSEDESVSLRISVKTEGHVDLGRPMFSAPDFEFINEYQSTYMESIFENGKFMARNTQTLTKVLRPKKVGTFTISRIQITINGKVHSAPDLQVTVRPGGQGAQQPRGYGGAGVGLRGAGKNSHGAPVIVRAELSKSKAYKGEQIIVEYFLYRKVRVFNIQVEKFPMLNGFLKEDLSVPVLQRLDTDQVMLDGVPYDRSLLAKYAAYPLEVGKMKIDTLSLKYNYYSNQSSFGDSDDPFANFFQQLSPRSGQSRSEQASVDVLPLPSDGRPASFSGGVGDFTVSSSVSGTDVRANEALTFNVKIEGQGNLAAIEEPKANWPDNVEVYDTKGKAKMGPGGVGEKLFEFLLIPRNQGKVTLPAIEFSFFDTAKNAYVTRSTKPIDINVLPALPGSAQVSVKRKSNKEGDVAPSPDMPSKKENLRYLKPPVPDMAAEVSGVPFWRAIFWVAMTLILLFAAFITKDFIRRGEKYKARNALAESKSWDKLLSRATRVGKSTDWNEVVRIYELLMGAVFDAIDRVYSVGARSHSRADLERILVQNHGLSHELWQKISAVLEYGEFVRFAVSSHTGADQRAREELPRWVKEGKALAEKLAQPSVKT